MRLKKIETKVTEILERYPETRKDDWLLLKEFYDTYFNTRQVPFATVCERHEFLDLPSFESIRRCRQKVQAERKDLIDPSTAKYRRKLTEEYEEYAKV